MNIRDHRLLIAYQYALSSYGLREFPGDDNNPEVSKFMKTTWYDDSRDSVHWCSAFVNWAMEKALLPHTDSPAARSWLEWGEETNYPVLGDLCVLRRRGGNHVAWYVAGGRGKIALLGGNQKDSVCISDYLEDDVLSFRTMYEPLASRQHIIPLHNQVILEEV